MHVTEVTLCSEHQHSRYCGTRKHSFSLLIVEINVVFNVFILRHCILKVSLMLTFLSR